MDQSILQNQTYGGGDKIQAQTTQFIKPNQLALEGCQRLQNLLGYVRLEELRQEISGTRIHIHICLDHIFLSYIRLCLDSC